LGGEAMTDYLARLLEIPLSNATIPSDYKTTKVVPIYKGVIDRLSQTVDSKLKICSLQSPGTRYSRVFEASLGKE
jgi:hypothetical protein